MGFGVAGWAKNEDQAAPVVNLISLPMTFLSGVFFPREAMPDVLQRITDFLPLTYLADALRKITNDGAGVADISQDLLGSTVWAVISVPHRAPPLQVGVDLGRWLPPSSRTMATYSAAVRGQAWRSLNRAAFRAISARLAGSRPSSTIAAASASTSLAGTKPDHRTVEVLLDDRGAADDGRNAERDVLHELGRQDPVGEDVASVGDDRGVRPPQQGRQLLGWQPFGRELHVVGEAELRGQPRQRVRKVAVAVDDQAQRELLPGERQGPERDVQAVPLGERAVVHERERTVRARRRDRRAVDRRSGRFIRTLSLSVGTPRVSSVRRQVSVTVITRSANDAASFSCQAISRTGSDDRDRPTGSRRTPASGRRSRITFTPASFSSRAEKTRKSGRVWTWTVR